MCCRHPNNSNIVEGMVKALARVVSTVQVRSNIFWVIYIFSYGAFTVKDNLIGGLISFEIRHGMGYDSSYPMCLGGIHIPWLVPNLRKKCGPSPGLGITLICNPTWQIWD